MARARDKQGRHCKLGFELKEKGEGEDEGGDWKWAGWDVSRENGEMLNAFWKCKYACVRLLTFKVTAEGLGRNVATTVVAKEVSPGEHLLHCEVMHETDDPEGSHEIRLIAVDAA